MPRKAHPIRQVLTRFFRVATRTYFREIEVVGDVPTADVRGRLFAANHVNALVDPLVLVTCTECPLSPVAKSTLWKIRGLSWLLDVVEAVPIVRRRDDPNKSEKDNDAVFERVGMHLKDGGNILIFPEGTSHNEPHLVGFRSGAGRMLARAKAEGGRDLEVQAVGLEFDERDIFRSRVLVTYGRVVRIDSLGDLEGDALATAITDTIRDELTELVVEGKTWEERALITRVAELLSNDAGDDSLETRNVIGRRVEAARKVLADESETLHRVRDAVDAYYRALGEVRTSDALVRRPESTLESRSVLGLAALLAVVPLALVGTILYFLPYQVPRQLVRATDQEHSDMTSTYKFGAGLVLFPVWALLLSVLGFVFLPTSRAIAACGVIVASPFAALAWLDHLPRLSDTFGLVLGRGRGRLEHLRDLRRRAIEAIEYGRKQIEGDAPPPAAT